ncbi:MAG: ribonuclease H-like YkuK family protein [Firmicutes bacterium]|nr:ribonuclease H-like YkuK family protein [Bacillota bacterium]
MVFESPTKGRLTQEQMYKDILSYIAQDTQSRYKLIVGTDSHTRTQTLFVTAIVIHRLGKGGRYYFHKYERRAVRSLRQKILYETSMSLTLAAKLTSWIEQTGLQKDLDVEIHCDVGHRGETKELIREIVGMVTGSGYQAAIKPDSFGASKVADKHTK